MTKVGTTYKKESAIDVMAGATWVPGRHDRQRPWRKAQPLREGRYGTREGRCASKSGRHDRISASRQAQPTSQGRCDRPSKLKEGAAYETRKARHMVREGTIDAM